MIDALRGGDVAALAQLLADLPLMQRYRRSAGALATDLRAGLERGDGLLVSRDAAGAAPTGVAWFTPTGTLGLGGYLRLLAVGAGDQGRGTGAALLAAFETALAGARSRHAFLLASDFNTAAQRFYQAHGYVQVGRLPGLVVPDVDELILWKRLAR